MTSVRTFAPFAVSRVTLACQSVDWDQWIVPAPLANASDATLQAVVALRRTLQPTGGMDGGALNRLLIQATTGLSPEQQA